MKTDNAPKFVGIKAPESISDMLWKECEEFCDSEKMKMKFLDGESKITMYCKIPRKVALQMEEKGIDRSIVYSTLKDFQEMLTSL